MRHRIDDIPMLAEYFIEKHSTRNGKTAAVLEEEAVRALQQHDWPGNVRELENTVERVVVLSTGRTIGRDAIAIDAATPSRDFGMPSLRIRDNFNGPSARPFAGRSGPARKSARRAH